MISGIVEVPDASRQAQGEDGREEQRHGHDETTPLQTPQQQESREKTGERVGGRRQLKNMASFFIPGVCVGVCVGVCMSYFWQQLFPPDFPGLEGNGTIRGRNVTMISGWENASTTLSTSSGEADDSLGFPVTSRWLTNSSFPSANGGSAELSNIECFIDALQQWMFRSINSCLQKSEDEGGKVGKCIRNEMCSWITSLHRGLGKIPGNCGVQRLPINQTQEGCLQQSMDWLLAKISEKMGGRCADGDQ